MTEPHAWLVMELGIGSARTPFVVSARTDGTVKLTIGSYLTYTTVTDSEQLQDVIDALTLVRDAVEGLSNDEG